jgi:TetR/AcrR family transcriptional regulator
MSVTGQTAVQTPSSTRDRLIAAALDAFSRTGFDGTSNRDIERQAGAERGLLTYHFGSKQELWNITVDQLFERYTSELESLREALRDVVPRERTRALIMAYARFNARNPELFRILVLESHAEGERSDRLAVHLKRAMTVFTDLTGTLSAISVRMGIRVFQIIGASGSLYSLANLGERTFGQSMYESDFLDLFATTLAEIAMETVDPDDDTYDQAPIHFLGD